MDRIRELNHSIEQEVDVEAKKLLRKRLRNYKRQCRKANWKGFITEVLSNKKHWALFNAMDRNRTLLGRKTVKNNVIESRAAFVENWKRDLNKIYTKLEPAEIPIVSEFDEIEETDLQILEDLAEDIPVTVEDFGNAFKGKSLTSSAGMNAIGYEMPRYAFIANPY